MWRPAASTGDEDYAAESRSSTPALPLLENTPIRWEVGDVDAGFKNADYILDETIVHQSPAISRWSRDGDGLLAERQALLHGSTQSVARTVANVAQWVNIPQSDVVVISEYTGGGFGGKIPGAQTMAIPAILSKKTGRPVMMRITREEENYIGRARAGIHLRVKIGFRKDGRILAMDMCAIGDCGPYSNQGDVGTVGSNATALYNPESIRFRGVAVLTNTPPRVSQRAPGGEQAAAMLEPMISKAARHLGVDQVEIRKINAPITGSEFGPPPPPAAAGAAAAAAAALVRVRVRPLARLPSRSPSLSSRGARVEEGRRLRDKCRVSSLWLLRLRLHHRSVRSSRAATCAKRSIWARSCSSGTSARAATASASAQRRSASASASAHTRPVRSQWTDCC